MHQPNESTLIVLLLPTRLKTIADSDLIIVLKDGYVAEQGSHHELLRRDGVYGDMWRRQSAETDLEGHSGEGSGVEGKAEGKAD